MRHSTRDILEYTIALVSEFAKRFLLSDVQAFRYLRLHNGIKFIEEHYGIIHTLDFSEAVDSLAMFCRKTGGKL